MKHTLLLPDGSEIGSGSAGAAIRWVRLTDSVNPWQELFPGGVCAGELEAELFADPGRIAPGDRLELYGGEARLGIYWVSAVTAPGPGRLKITAYDAVIHLDADATEFLSAQTFPLPLGDLARGLAEWFGLELEGELLSADYPVPAFAARGITGRQLLAWICQAGGVFCRATNHGALSLSWYGDTGITLTPGGEHFYFAGSLERSDFETAPITRVRLALREDDAGLCWPETGDNVLSLVGNPLLTGEALPVAQRLYERLSGLRYTPCRLETTTALRPGDRFTVETPDGPIQTLCMSAERSGGRYRLQCTGSVNRAAPEAVCESGFLALNGRMLNLRRELDGVTTQMARFGQTLTEVSRLSQTSDQITARVAALETDTDALGKSLEELEAQATGKFAQLQLRSDSLEIAVGSVQAALDDKADGQTVRELTEHFRFDEAGLTISDSATGMGIGISEEQITFTGGRDPTTRITPRGLQTTDLQVERGLSLGSFAFLPRPGGNLSLRWTGQ